VPKFVSFGKIDVEVVSSLEKASGVPEKDTPFRVALLGDFSGRASRGIFDSALANRKPIIVDRDNINDVMKKLGVEIKLSIFKNASPITIRFSEVDDFHPDHLFESLEVFEALRDTRQSLMDPHTIATLVKEMEGEEKPIQLPEPRENMEMLLQKAAAQSAGSLLEQVLNETEKKPQQDQLAGRTSEWDGFIQNIVKTHAVPDVEQRQKQMIAKVDTAISELMRMVLHYPDFQAIEAVWRGIRFLVSRLETDEHLKLYVIDISKDELASDLGSVDDLRTTGIYRLLVEQSVGTFGGEPWAVLAGNYTFQKTNEDITTLGRMAKIAKDARAPFIAAAHDNMLGCESLATTPAPENWTKSEDERTQDAWDTLRKMPDSSYLGLTIPRFLLRLPYGADTDPLERFAFEEMTSEKIHDRYLWANPSFACAYLLAETFRRDGWDFMPGSIQDIDKLPLHVSAEQDESRIKPCAEVVLTEVAVEAILERGLMPLLSYKNRDYVRLARFQSIADPLTGLNGRWTAG
jgi:type VI secretion system protein ImpC